MNADHIIDILQGLSGFLTDLNGHNPEVARERVRHIETMISYGTFTPEEVSQCVDGISTLISMIQEATENAGNGATTPQTEDQANSSTFGTEPSGLPGYVDGFSADNPADFRGGV